MKLLLITQKVDKNDSDLGYFHDWLLSFAQHVEELTIICLEKREHDLPESVRVLSLGKEKNNSRLARTIAFYRYIFNYRRSYNAVFVHMNPEYIALGGVVWRLWGKTIALWYVHRSVDAPLRIAEKFAHIIFTSAPTSFRLASKKILYMGHGVKTSDFVCPPLSENNNPLSILMIGRVTPIKHCETFIECARVLRDEYRAAFHITFVGPIEGEKDKKYKKNLDALVARYGLAKAVTFEGGVIPPARIRYFCKSTFTINLAPTGGLDKVVIESMASGRVVFTSNAGFAPYFGPYADMLIVDENDPALLARRIVEIHNTPHYGTIARYLSSVAQKTFDINALIPALIKHIEEKRP